MFGLITTLLTGGIGIAKDWLKSKGEENLAKQKAKQAEEEGKIIVRKAAAEAKAAAMKARMEGDVAWENIWSSGAQDSWKDEYWTIILSMPLILTMVPSVVSCLPFVGTPMMAAHHVREGLEAINAMPQWYQWGVGASIGASFGYRKITDFFAKKKGV